MTSQQNRRERAFSDKAQAAQTPIPKRPSLPNRTNSAPVGALHQMTTTTKVAPSAGQHKVGQQTVIEEDQSSIATTATTDSTTGTTATTTRTTSSGNPAMPSRVGDEVCFYLFNLIGIISTMATGCANVGYCTVNLQTGSSPCDNCCGRW